MGPNPVNMVAEPLLWCCFWPKNLSQAKMSEQGQFSNFGTNFADTRLMPKTTAALT